MWVWLAIFPSIRSTSAAAGPPSPSPEVVICTAGELTLVQEIDGKEVRTTLRPGEYAINPPGVWHTADVTGRATGVFITAGVGTQGRPR